MPDFKARKISIVIDDPDEAQMFRKGLILARQNNNSQYFPQLIEGVNSILEPFLEEQREELARGISPSTRTKVTLS
jgi:hypothetical protein